MEMEIDYEIKFKYLYKYIKMKNTANQSTKINFSHPWSVLAYCLDLKLNDDFHDKYGFYLHSNDSKEYKKEAFKHILNINKKN